MIRFTLFHVHQSTGSNKGGTVDYNFLVNAFAIFIMHCDIISFSFMAPTSVKFELSVPIIKNIE